MPEVVETFFTTIGCMDGRVQEVVDAFGRKQFNAQYPDTITDAGIVGKLPSHEEELLKELRFKLVDVSIGRHNSRGVIVHGHAECAGNPVPDEKQIEDIRQSVMIIKEMVPSLQVVGIFVHRDSNDPSRWVAEEIPSTITA